jgi:hypothetical protein
MRPIRPVQRSQSLLSVRGFHRSCAAWGLRKTLVAVEVDSKRDLSPAEGTAWARTRKATKLPRGSRVSRGEARAIRPTSKAGKSASSRRGRSQRGSWSPRQGRARQGRTQRDRAPRDRRGRAGSQELRPMGGQDRRYVAAVAEEIKRSDRRPSLIANTGIAGTGASRELGVDGSLGPGLPAPIFI